MLHVVIGAPCSGKSTYARDHSKTGDVIVDYDEIAKALGSSTPHRSEGAVREAAFRARSAVISYLCENANGVDGWVIHSKPTARQMERYSQAGAEFVELETDMQTCLERAERDNRPDGTRGSIEEWFGLRAAGDGGFSNAREAAGRSISRATAKAGKEGVMPEETTALGTQEAANAAHAPQGAGTENPPMEGSRTYTQEEFDAALEAAVKERTAGAIRERVDRANKQKKELAGENKELSEQVKALTEELEQFKSRELHRELVKKVSDETGVPAELLRGSTEDELAAHAESLKAYISQPSAPYVGSDGFAAGEAERSASVQERFSDAIDDLLSR